MLFKWEIEGSGADSKQPILSTLTMSVMFLTQTYHLSTAGRVKLELENNKRPNIDIFIIYTP